MFMSPGSLQVCFWPMPFPICFVNLTISGGLLHVFFPAQMPPPWQLCVSALIGALAIALWLAHHFGKVRNAAPHP
jgi:L-asparagine transporter-like permease